jgi:hypothetical protein
MGRMKPTPTEQRDAHQGFLHPPPSRRDSRWGFRGMTVRDWLQLLIVPFALVVISFLFTAQQGQRQQQTENQRAEAERELAEQRAQDEALQAYLDQMTQLILDRKLLEAEAGDSVYALAQARTSTMITRLDAEHIRSVTRFLTDSGLTGAGESSISVLRRIDLTGADLSGALLVDAELSGAQLDHADLSGANLAAADLTGADLSRADGVTNAELEQPAESLEGATMPNGQKYEDWLKNKGRGEDGENAGSS